MYYKIGIVWLLAASKQSSYVMDRLTSCFPSLIVSRLLLVQYFVKHRTNIDPTMDPRIELAKVLEAFRFP